MSNNNILYQISNIVKNYLADKFISTAADQDSFFLEDSMYSSNSSRHVMRVDANPLKQTNKTKSTTDIRRYMGCFVDPRYVI